MSDNLLQQLLQAIKTLQDLGKVAYFNKGAYNSETTYEINDVITYQGSSYVSLDNNNQGNLPTNTTYWSIVALKGEKGDTGKPFVIEKTYSSVEDMVADYDNMNINDYVMISGNIEEEQNATLWTKTETPAPTYKWVYLADFSGASGITGQTPNIQIGNVTEGNEPAVTRRQGSSNENPILDFVLKTGATGATGATGNGISQVSKTSTSGLTDTYTISYTSGNSTTFDVTNGKGITSIAKTGTSGLVDTYTITYNDGTTSTFTITNGEDGEVTQAQLDEVQAELDRYKTLANVLPKATGEGTEITLNNCGASLLKMQPKGNTQQDSYTGKNLLKPNSETNTRNGITCTYDPIDQTYTFNGSCTTDNTGFQIGNQPIDFTNGITTVSAYWLGGNVTTYCVFRTFDAYYGRSTPIDLTDLSSINPIKSETCNGGDYTAVANGMTIRFNRGSVANNLKVKFMIANSTDTTYEPYVGGTPSPNPDYPQDVRVVTGNNTIHISNSDNTISQEYPLNLGSIELCKIGDYQDYIYKNNGKWYKHSEIGKIVLDGSENWSMATDSRYFFYNNNIFPMSSSGSAIYPMYSKHFISNKFDLIYEGSIDYGIAFAYNFHRMVIRHKDITLKDDFKTWLSTHNLIVYYVLEIPTNTEITDTTLIGQLNALNDALSFDGQTNISSEYTSGNAPVIISAEAIAKFSS